MTANEIEMLETIKKAERKLRKLSDALYHKEGCGRHSAYLDLSLEPIRKMIKKMEKQT